MNPVPYTPRDELFLWWLADPAQPRLVGRLRLVRRTAGHPGGVSLEYDPAWLAEGLALSEDLPLRPGEFLPVENDAAAGAVDDARPDRWGERVIRHLYKPPRLSTLEYLYFAGDERFGALGVSSSAQRYEPQRQPVLPVVGDVPALYELVRRIEAGEPVDESLQRLVAPGTTLGGARPKAQIEIDGHPWVLKFADAGDPNDSPLIEHATMTLAARAGISVCETRPLTLLDGHAVAVRRFDRADGQRLHALSAHVALRAAASEAGYPELALLLRRRGDPAQIAANGAQVFRRMVFNVLIDNTDDHEKNHALLVQGRSYALAPAFDVLPSGQALGYQQFRVGALGLDASAENLVSEPTAFGLRRPQAQALAREVAEVVDGWQAHFAACGVSAGDLGRLAEQIDRPYLLGERRALMNARP
ncbi:type II toxin-antitoxin system HipA family toxin [Hylemonella sp. W303a]|uniref:type II toxin-antitoxin system HipA family toxin n=1 Tax=Hylemonella sp. W303a TaxID=3389873 RepID=UPI00396AFADF